VGRSSKGIQTLVLAGVKKHHGEYMELPVFVALFSRAVVYLGYYASNNFDDLYKSSVVAGKNFCLVL
jgi:hypothetical protein